MCLEQVGRIVDCLGPIAHTICTVSERFLPLSSGASERLWVAHAGYVQPAHINSPAWPEGTRDHRAHEWNNRKPSINGQTARGNAFQIFCLHSQKTRRLVSLCCAQDRYYVLKGSC